MRTVRCSSRLLEGVCLPRGRDVSAHRGRLPGGCLPGGCLPRGVSGRNPPGRHPPWADTTLWTEWQKFVKTLPCRNYVADGNNVIQEETCRFSRLSDVLSENVIFTIQFNNIKASSSLSVGEGWDKNTIGWKWHFEGNMWQFRM